MYFLWYILIGLVSGYIASKIMKGSGSGLIINLFVGIIGGVLGGWLLSLFGFIAIGTIGSLITSVIGAIVFLWIVSFFQRSAKK
ncbi:MAG: GlsB/YeaQ/YmgE family stress response membrane protein [Bacteroidales bacterium]|nr:GlsB/YeaQ/YmgE family stress response membrane protein [Bacteroidales bacterium]